MIKFLIALTDFVWTAILVCMALWLFIAVASAQPSPPSGPPAPLDQYGHWIFVAPGEYRWVYPPMAKVAFPRGVVKPPTAKVDSVKTLPYPGAKVGKPVTLPPAPALAFRHDCACPSSASCNCAPAACHCAENRPFNRAPLRWVPNGEQWLLKRLDVTIGAVNSTGDYYPVGDDGECQQTPTTPPIALPKNYSMVPATTAVCRT